MHGLVKHFWATSIEGKARLKELFGWAGARKPITFWYAGSGDDISPIVRLTKPDINYRERTNYTPRLNKKPELFIYTDAITPFDTETEEDILMAFQRNFNEWEDFEVRNIHKLKIDNRSNLYKNKAYHKYFNYKQFNGYEFDEEFTQVNAPEHIIENAYLIDIVIRNTSKKISIFIWRIGNMKFLKDVALSNKMTLDYILMGNTGNINSSLIGYLILSAIGALKTKKLFILDYHITDIENYEIDNITDYLEDRMLFMTASKNKFSEYFTSYTGRWQVGNIEVSVHHINHLDNILTFKKQEEIRKIMLDSANL